MKNTQKIFITGITGVVGQYLLDLLKDDEKYHLYLLMRTPEKLSQETNRKNITVLKGALDDIAQFKDILSTVDFVIHIATAWGGRQAMRVNVQRSLELFKMADNPNLKKIIYFSTASILSDGGHVYRTGELYGSEYVRTKYWCYQLKQNVAAYDKIYTVFPTLVFGGGKDGKPTSHVTSGIEKLKKLLPFINGITIDTSFNFIHAKDIALITKHIMENNIASRDLTLGNPAVTADNILDNLCTLQGKKPRKRKDITKFALFVMLKILKNFLTKWQIYSLQTRHFVFDCVNTENFGIDSPYKDIQECLKG